ncbi:hypothetical protein ANANG_G00026070, partial [Anguilla anguilla]
MWLYVGRPLSQRNCGGNMLLSPMQAMPLMETEIPITTMDPVPTLKGPTLGGGWTCCRCTQSPPSPSPTEE